MSQSTSNRPSLHPVLEASLSSLDLRLEDELARYRRLRPKPKRSQPELRSERIQPLELFESGRTPPVVMSPSPTTDVASPVSPTPPPEETAAKTTSSPEESAEVSEVSSIVHQPIPEGQGFSTTGNEPPQDYLESSEQLLRSLGLEDPESQPENSLKNTLFTPLGIGSILVLLVASALVGSAFIDSEGFSHLRLDRLGIGKKDQPTPLNETSSPVVQPIETSPTLNPSPGVSAPNLTQGEFEELDLQTLPTLPVESPTAAIVPSPSQPTTNPTTSPATPNNVQDLTSALLPPALRPSAVEPVTEASPAPEAIEPSDPAPAPTNKNMYYVMADYTGENTFANAVSLVPDAYLVKLPQGVHIQMAAFGTETQAKEFAQELQDEGFTATVYHP